MSDPEKPVSKPRLSLSRRMLIGAVVWSLIAVVGGIIAMTISYRAQTMRLLEQELDSHR